MEKRCISIVECEPGNIVAQKVVSKYGGTIVVENTTINNYIKEKLIAFEIGYMWIYVAYNEESTKCNDFTFTQLKKGYKRNVLEIKEVLNDLGKGNKVTTEKIKLISNSIYDSLDNEYYAVRYLNELRFAEEEMLFNHSVNVSLYAMLLGKWLLLPQSKIINLIQAGLFHDVGKIKLPESILNKKEKLETTEFEQVKKHPIYGFDLIKNIDGITKESKDAVLMHHERENNSGYPLGISGDEMNICSKIIAITNFYDSITSERIYRKRVTPFEAFEIIQSEIIGNFDIHIVNTFLSNLAACYVGAKVLLNSGEVGEIVYVPPQAIAKPIVFIDFQYIDLSKESNLKIVNMI